MLSRRGRLGEALKRLLCGVQGQIGIDDAPPEVRVVRLAECHLKQKAGYVAHALTMNTPETAQTPTLFPLPHISDAQPDSENSVLTIFREAAVPRLANQRATKYCLGIADGSLEVVGR